MIKSGILKIMRSGIRDMTAYLSYLFARLQNAPVYQINYYAACYYHIFDMANKKC